MIPFSARGKREWWENRWNWYVREYYQCSKCQRDEVLWPFGPESGGRGGWRWRMHTKIKPQNAGNQSKVANLKLVQWGKKKCQQSPIHFIRLSGGGKTEVRSYDEKHQSPAPFSDNALGGGKNSFECEGLIPNTAAIKTHSMPRMGYFFFKNKGIKSQIILSCDCFIIFCFVCICSHYNPTILGQQQKPRNWLYFSSIFGKSLWRALQIAGRGNIKWTST